MILIQDLSVADFAKKEFFDQDYVEGNVKLETRAYIPVQANIFYSNTKFNLVQKKLFP